MIEEKDSFGKREALKASAFIVLAVLIGAFAPVPETHGMSMDSKRADFIELKEEIVGSLLPEGKYRCCLEKPCIYCIMKTPKHGEGAECSCLEDIANGRHPCGECIGEIMEGHGNRYLSKYFAKAIAEEMGEGHLPALKQMMAEKYGIPVEEQA